MRRRADEVAGLQILRRAAGVRGRDADDGADAERDRRVAVAGPAERDEDQAGEDQRRDRHARNRVRRGADEAGDARRHRDEEEPEDDDRESRRGSCPASASSARRARKIASSSEPTSTTIIGMSRSVRIGAAPPRRRRSPSCCRGTTTTIVGIVRAERDQARREHRAGADVADVGAPQLLRRSSRRSERQAGRRVVREVRMNRRERHRACRCRGSRAAAAAPATTARRRRTSSPAMRGPMT